VPSMVLGTCTCSTNMSLSGIFEGVKCQESFDSFHGWWSKLGFLKTV
jgi:hypothetical protein